MTDSSDSARSEQQRAKPDLAIVARRLLSNCRAGALATQSVKHPEFPFASMVPFATDQRGGPLIFVSGLATHSRNLKANPKASLLVSEGESFSDARATLVGTFGPVPEDEREAAMETYLQRHAEARQWASFGDFTLLRMEIVDVYIVAGFGVMGWIKSEEL